MLDWVGSQGNDSELCNGNMEITPMFDAYMFVFFSYEVMISRYSPLITRIIVF